MSDLLGNMGASTYKNTREVRLCFIEAEQSKKLTMLGEESRLIQEDHAVEALRFTMAERE